MRNPTFNRTKGTHMRGTPVYYLPSKKISTTQFYRNHWCTDYERCLTTAAREDLYLDCAKCKFRDNILEDFSIFLKKEL